MTRVNCNEMREVFAGRTYSVEYHCKRCNKDLVFTAKWSLFAYAKLALHQGGIGCKKKK